MTAATVTMTVILSKEEKRNLKRIAVDRDMSVSALIRQWIDENTATAERSS